MTTMNESWVQRRLENPEARRLFEQERLILSATEGVYRALEEAGVSKADLARELGSSRANVTALLNGSRNMTLRTLADLASVLGQRVEITMEPLRHGEFVNTPVRAVRSLRPQRVEMRGAQGTEEAAASDVVEPPGGLRMATNLQRAGEIARRAQLEAIALRRAKTSSTLDPLGDPPEDLQLSQAYRARYELPPEHAGYVYVHVDFEFSAAEPDADGAVVQLDATYLLVYGLSGEDAPDDDALEHFAELNGAYNAWPYWRELVQTVTGRVGLASIVIPVFRPPVRKLEEDDAAEKPAARSKSAKKPAGSSAVAKPTARKRPSR